MEQKVKVKDKDKKQRQAFYLTLSWVYQLGLRSSI
jgi:hypothetical protein